MNKARFYLKLRLERRGGEGEHNILKLCEAKVSIVVLVRFVEETITPVLKREAIDIFLLYQALLEESRCKVPGFVWVNILAIGIKDSDHYNPHTHQRSHYPRKNGWKKAPMVPLLVKLIH